MKRWFVVLLVAPWPTGCLGDPLAVGDERQSTEQDTDAGTETEVPVDCDMDEDAPTLADAVPGDGQIGVDPDGQFSFTIEDPCEIEPSSLVLEIGGAPVVPTVGGTAEQAVLSWDPAGTFALDEVSTVRVYAEDLAGNPLDVTIVFRIWDEFTYFSEAINGIDEAAPDTHVIASGSFPVRAGDGDEGRMLVRLNVDAEPAGTIIVDGQLRFCSDEVPAAATVLTCHALRQGFGQQTVTWNDRDTGMPWSTPGADAVPADHDASVMATVPFTVGQAAFSDSFGEVNGDSLNEWFIGGNHGFVCLGDANGIGIGDGASNCPPFIEGHLGRPL